MRCAILQTKSAMLIEEVLQLPPAEAWETLIQKEDRTVEKDTIAAQIDPDQHAVMNTSLRPDKAIKKYEGKDNAGKDIYRDSTQSVNRIAIPIQETIVERAVGFLLGTPVELSASPESDAESELLNMIDRVWTKNKLDYRNRDIARTLFSETEVAELWYVVTDESFWKEDGIVIRPKMRILKPSDGETLLPFYDESDDMVAFSRLYSITRGEDEVEVLETYTPEWIYTFENLKSIELISRIANPFGKIPVVYYSQKYPDWYRVQILIERLETLLSNFGDTNDYFGSPMIFVSGEVKGFSTKGEQGKIIQGDKGTAAEYLSWDSGPDSIKLEIDTLKDLIYTLTQTPDISFSQMKGLGNLSGVALKMMFLDAHMKAENKIEIMGEMFQRRINLIAKICTVANIKLEPVLKTLDIEPVFTPYLPRNEKEEMETLTTGTSKAIMSQKTAVKNNPFVQNADAEMKLIEVEAKEAASRQTFEF